LLFKAVKGTFNEGMNTGWQCFTKKVAASQQKYYKFNNTCVTLQSNEQNKASAQNYCENIF